MSKSIGRFVDFRRVKESVSITQILERYGLMAQLRRVNDDSLTGTCPIHKGENKTAFRVSISKNCWNCFSQCHCGGNTLDFVSRMENVTLLKAASLIAEWFHVDDAFDVPIKQERSSGSSFTGSKKESTQDKAAKEKVPQPQTEDETITENKPLAFSLQHLERTHPYLQERGLSEQTIATFGLGFCKKGTMANRIAIPIHSHNHSGQLVAYAGRWPGEPPEDDEKYKLPKGFRKTLEVFNLHRIAETDPTKPVIVVEGFFGCMKLWQAGQQRVVSVMGSSVSDHQETAILKAAVQSRKIVLMFDEDVAGREGRELALKRFASKAYVKVIELGKNDLQPDQLSSEQINDLLSFQEVPVPYVTLTARFPFGQLVATPNALSKVAHENIMAAVNRHIRGDWGELDQEDKEANERALENGGRLLSVYRSLGGTKFYIITEADRSVSTILLPEDY